MGGRVVRGLARLADLFRGAGTLGLPFPGKQVGLRPGGIAGTGPFRGVLPADLTQARGVVLPAEVENEFVLPKILNPRLKVYHDGAISLISEEEEQLIRRPPTQYANVDGQRIDDGRYRAFIADIASFVPDSRRFTDALRTFAYGTDASFYRLNPKLVVKVNSEEEIRQILPLAKKHQVPVTFRASGTSLAGQAITDSVLLKITNVGNNFRNYQIHGDGSSITVETGLLGGEVNRLLARHKVKTKHPVMYKIGPDPASIDSAAIGGIVANNASGMCCGVAQNTYHTIKDLRAIFLDGTVLDTKDPDSCAAFLKDKAKLCAEVSALATRVQADPQLSALIRRKFAIKNTVGYSLNALVDFPANKPIEIIKHLLVGSEGTLGFVSNVTFTCVPEWPHKASAFVLFPDILTACQAASVLRDQTSVDAVELFDAASLKEATNELLRLVSEVAAAGETGAALLMECRGQTPEMLKDKVDQVVGALQRSGLPFGIKKGDRMPIAAYPFRANAKECKTFWDFRKGLVPIVGAAREPGTSMVIEDVACPVEHLGEMSLDLIEMFQRYGYKEASLMGHALEGNLHTVFSQGFRSADEVANFGDMMQEMGYIVATKYGGSLKGEHGTGRNMAPFVELEWGSKAYDLMWELKEIFDPYYLLNPGVILNKDPEAHTKFLKPSPPASPLVDACIECGYCEAACPSRDVTLTPRQRIATYREMARLKGKETPERIARLEEFEKAYAYLGKQTCAADGMCQTRCPVSINTGSLIKAIRRQDMAESPWLTWTAMYIASHMRTVNALTPMLLNVVDWFHGKMGPKPLEIISKGMNTLTRKFIPVWQPYMPKGATSVNLHPTLPPGYREVEAVAMTEGGGIPCLRQPKKVVYLPTCVTRMMGPSRSDPVQATVHDKMISLFQKAGYEVLIPKNLGKLCCGMLFNTRGFTSAAALKTEEVKTALLHTSMNGQIPIVIDTSPCAKVLKDELHDANLKRVLYEPVQFIKEFLVPELEFTKVKDSVSIHVPCTSKQMGVTDDFVALASLCANEVTDTGIPCCGMAGDRGMRFTELNKAAVQHLDVPEGVKDGYSTSRTCEMGLSQQAGFDFRSIVFLVDEAARPKKATV